jgi:hypothetical protein
VLFAGINNTSLTLLSLILIVSHTTNETVTTRAPEAAKMIETVIGPSFFFLLLRSNVASTEVSTYSCLACHNVSEKELLG